MNIKELIEQIEQNPIEKGGQIYHPIPFPEFEHLTTSSNPKGVLRKWGKIKSVCNEIFGSSFDKINVLDIGANAGFYTFNFAKLGARIKAFECHERYKKVGKIIAKEKNLQVEWMPQAFNAGMLSAEQHFNVALLLSVYQWMANGDLHDLAAKKSLMEISKHSDYLFFELNFNSGKSCVKTTKINHYAELIGFLQEATCYKYFKLITKTRLWRGSKRFLVLCSNDMAWDDTGLIKIRRKIKM